MREFERLHLQRELLVDDCRHLGAGGDPISFLHVNTHDGAADAGAGDEQMNWLDRGDHRLSVIDLDRMNAKLVG